MIRWLRKNWLIVWNGSRWPYTQKGALISAGGWVIALAAVALSIIADFITDSWDWVGLVLVIGAGDTIMLVRTVQGLLWRRRVDRWRRSGAWRS
jgi:hypothetical protein